MRTNILHPQIPQLINEYCYAYFDEDGKVNLKYALHSNQTRRASIRGYQPLPWLQTDNAPETENDYLTVSHQKARK